MNNAPLGDENYEGAGYEDLGLEALLPLNQNLASLAMGDGEGDESGQKLKQARLMEALEKQTALLDSISQSYQKNRELRQKADLRKLKHKLEKLEMDKMFRELEIQQVQAANDIAQQNNQLIFSHLSNISPYLVF